MRKHFGEGTTGRFALVVFWSTIAVVALMTAACGGGGSGEPFAAGARPPSDDDVSAATEAIADDGSEAADSDALETAQKRLDESLDAALGTEDLFSSDDHGAFQDEQPQTSVLDGAAFEDGLAGVVDAIAAETGPDVLAVEISGDRAVATLPEGETAGTLAAASWTDGIVERQDAVPADGDVFVDRPYQLGDVDWDGLATLVEDSASAQGVDPSSITSLRIARSHLFDEETIVVRMLLTDDGVDHQIDVATDGELVNSSL